MRRVCDAASFLRSHVRTFFRSFLRSFVHPSVASLCRHGSIRGKKEQARGRKKERERGSKFRDVQVHGARREQSASSTPPAFFRYAQCERLRNASRSRIKVGFYFYPFDSAVAVILPPSVSLDDYATRIEYRYPPHDIALQCLGDEEAGFSLSLVNYRD